MLSRDMLLVAVERVSRPTSRTVGLRYLFANRNLTHCRVNRGMSGCVMPA